MCSTVQGALWSGRQPASAALCYWLRLSVWRDSEASGTVAFPSAAATWQAGCASPHLASCGASHPQKKGVWEVWHCLSIKSADSWEAWAKRVCRSGLHLCLSLIIAGVRAMKMPVFVFFSSPIGSPGNLLWEYWFLWACNWGNFLQNRAFSFVLHKLCVQNLTSDCHVRLPLLPPSGFSVQQLWTIIICVFGLFTHYVKPCSQVSLGAE